MNTELQTSIVAKINEEHAVFMRLGHASADALIALLNKGREIGLHLAELKRTTPHGEFGKMFATDHGRPNERPAFHFSREHGGEFMRYAAANPSPIVTLAKDVNSFKDALRLCGVIPEAQRDLQYASTVGPLSQMKKIFNSAWAIFVKEKEKKPLEKWDTPRLHDVVTTYTPAWQLVEDAKSTLAERGEE